MTTEEERPLPPGDMGWPLLGETLALLRDNYRFVSDRVARHGPVFRSNVLGRKTVFLTGPAGTALFNDAGAVQRAGGMPDFVEQFFGGKSLPILDGPTHGARKEQVMAAFSRQALEAYLPAMQAAIEDRLARLASQGEFRATDELKLLALEVIGRNLLGLEPGPELDAIVAGFTVLTRGFSGLPIALPWTKFTKALQARDAIFEVVRAVVQRHRERDHGDGLSRMLAARAADGSAITDEGALLELHHFNIAGYLIYTLFCALIVELDRSAGVRARLVDEIDRAATSGPLTVSALAGMPELGRVVREAKRFTPFVALFFGKAKRDFEIDGLRVPEGWTVIWSQHATNHAASSFAEPERFDPERFSEARAEDRRHPCAFAPQGAGDIQTGHMCAGYDYSTLFLQAFTVLLVRRYTWTLPEQDLAYVYEQVPPEHADGLRVVLTPR